MRDFTDSMNDSPVKINSNKKWNILKVLYDNFELTSEQKIPKKIHQIWLGGGLPSNYEYLTNTWLINNPDWEYKLWTDDDVKNMDIINRKAFDSMSNLGSKSDILRYEILYNHGGVYIDTDFYCVKSFNDLLSLDFFTGTGHQSETYLLNGLIACTKGNNIIFDCINKIGDNITFKNFDNVMSLTGPYFFTDVFFSNVTEDTKNVVVFPTTFFYPFPSALRFKIKNNLDLALSYIKDETYCVHLWSTSWQK